MRQNVTFNIVNPVFDLLNLSLLGMNRHDGVSCDSCLKANFRGRRFKCLLCFDYDLCSACYEAGATNTRHTTDHPMQCILTRADCELYYGGEALLNMDMPQAYTCPYCCRMGFTDVALQEHATAEHSEVTFEVVCPLCAAMPGGDPNFMTDDFAAHLTLEHRSGPRDLISFLDDPGARHNVRRIPHTTHTATHMGRGAAALRPRRTNMHFSVFNSNTGMPSLSPSSRDSVDPIAELLSQLSGVRRSTANSNSSTPTQLQQLQMQLQLERQQVNAARQQLERYPRRITQSQSIIREPTPANNSGTCTLLLNPTPLLQTTSTTSSSITSSSSQSLLSGVLEEMASVTICDEERQERVHFVQELVFSSICTEDEKKPESPLLFFKELTRTDFADLLTNFPEFLKLGSEAMKSKRIVD